MLLAFVLAFGMMPMAFAQEVGTMAERIYWNDGDSIPGQTISTDTVITVTGDVAVTNTITITDGASVTVTGGGTITRVIAPFPSPSSFVLFTVAEAGGGSTLTLDNITIDGNLRFGRLVVIQNGSELVMNSGATLQNSHGGAVQVNSGGTFNMYGGAISGNSDFSSGGGVSVVGGTFNMHGGTISGNSASLGGGVEILGGIFNLHGGTISGNSANIDNGGDGIYALWGIFNIIGNFVNQNQIATAVGINIAPGGTLTNNDTIHNPSGGTITNNGTIINNNTFINDGLFITDSGVFANNGTFINNGTVIWPRDLTIELHGGTGGPVFPSGIPRAAWAIPATPFPTRENHTFNGWALTDGGTAVTYIEAGATPVTLYALWFEVPPTGIADTTRAVAAMFAFLAAAAVSWGFVLRGKISRQNSRHFF